MHEAIAEFVKTLDTNEPAAATAATAWLLEEPPSSTAFEHPGGKQRQTAELRDYHDNNQQSNTNILWRTFRESHNAMSYQD